MILWFVGLSFLVVWLVFQSPAIDYRTIVVGSLIPLIDLAGVGVLPVAHTVSAAAIAFAVVIVATIGRRLTRRRWLGIPIGWFLHLGLDGTWTNARLFWWPFLGLDDRGGVPEAGRSVITLIAMELVGAAVLLWAWRRFSLADTDSRRTLIQQGRLTGGPGR